MNIIKNKNWFFALSLAVIIPGLIALSMWGLKLGIDFSGGTLWEVKITESKVVEDQLTPAHFQSFLNSMGAQVSTTALTGKDTFLVRMRIADEDQINQVKDVIGERYGKTESLRLETVGPTISKELARRAISAVAIAIAAIVLYITWSFRKVPKPASSVAFGFCTVFALIHDVIVVVGVFAILGHFFNIEIDSLFITALLTVIGFSVHDTIVVFDRIRENLNKHIGAPFEEIVNHSLLQTMGRSLNTSLTAVFVLLALFLFGGESIKNFVLALLIGIISGTYSSIFNASPLLVVWQDIANKRRKN